MGRWGDRFSVKDGRRGCLRGCGSMQIFMLVVGFDYLSKMEEMDGMGMCWIELRADWSVSW